MSLRDWAANGFVRPHGTTAAEVADLLAAVDRDQIDARKDLSPDTAFSIAYNAALRLCTIALYASGYRAVVGRHHYYTIESLPVILGSTHAGLRNYLHACTKKRNIASYESVGAVSPGEVTELLDAVGELRTALVVWLHEAHPDLVGE